MKKTSSSLAKKPSGYIPSVYRFFQGVWKENSVRTKYYPRKTISSGIESAAKVEIVVLEGDFDDNVSDNWILEEFNAGKPLLHGNALLNLNEGIGVVGNLSFTDNSSWMGSRKFRLGARVLDICDGNRVREAKSESFTVRDHRGELGDCEVGSTKKACKNSFCGRAEQEEKVQKLGVTMDQLENLQSACRSESQMLILKR